MKDFLNIQQREWSKKGKYLAAAVGDPGKYQDMVKILRSKPLDLEHNVEDQQIVVNMMTLQSDGSQKEITYQRRAPLHVQHYGKHPIFKPIHPIQTFKEMADHKTTRKFEIKYKGEIIGFFHDLGIVNYAVIYFSVEQFSYYLHKWYHSGQLVSLPPLQDQCLENAPVIPLYGNTSHIR